MAISALMRSLKTTAVAVGFLALGTTAQAGSIYLTGHDVLLHSGQNGYDAVILDYLRGTGLTNEIAKGSYSISIVGSDENTSATARFTGGSTDFADLANGTAGTLDGTLTGYASATFYDAQDGDWGQILAADLLIILSHDRCGGCSTLDQDMNAIIAKAADIATAFNGGMDIWGLSGDDRADFYNFLPAGALASGDPISGSSGFTPTAAGTAIGIVDNMVNGFQTHNRFFDFDSDFTVYETRDTSEFISIGLQDGRIDDGGGIIIDDPKVSEPGTLAIMGLALAGLGVARRRRMSA